MDFATKELIAVRIFGKDEGPGQNGIVAPF